MIYPNLGHQAACLVRVPTEVVKSRAQTSSHSQSSRASLTAARFVLANDGFMGFYRGFGSTIMREVSFLPFHQHRINRGVDGPCTREPKIPFTSIQFPLYEFLKVRMARTLNRPSLGAHEAALCGSIAGGFAAALTTPLDVLKTRTMLDLRVCRNLCFLMACS